MKVSYANIEEWNSAVENIKKGLIICPECQQWTDSIYKIPSRLLDCVELTFSEFVIWGEKRINESCCHSCMAKRARFKVKREWNERFDKCRGCKGVFEKGIVGTYQRYSNTSPEYGLCPSCIKDKEEESRVYKSQQKIRLTVSNNNKRAEKLGLVADLTVKEWIDIVKLYDDKCAYCGDSWTDLEHIIPLSKGGGTTKSNVAPSCRNCNMKKIHRSDYVSPEFIDAHIYATCNQGQ